MNTVGAQRRCAKFRLFLFCFFLLWFTDLFTAGFMFCTCLFCFVAAICMTIKIILTLARFSKDLCLVYVFPLFCFGDQLIVNTVVVTFLRFWSNILLLFFFFGKFAFHSDYGFMFRYFAHNCLIFVLLLLIWCVWWMIFCLFCF